MRRKATEANTRQQAKFARRSTEFTHEPDADLGAHPRFVVGVMQAGTAPGAVPDTAVIKGDIRTVPSQTWQTVRADLERVARDAGAVVAVMVSAYAEACGWGQALAILPSIYLLYSYYDMRLKRKQDSLTTVSELV